MSDKEMQRGFDKAVRWRNSRRGTDTIGYATIANNQRQTRVSPLQFHTPD
jgi:transposase InsO family protein